MALVHVDDKGDGDSTGWSKRNRHKPKHKSMCTDMFEILLDFAVSGYEIWDAMHAVLVLGLQNVFCDWLSLLTET